MGGRGVYDNKQCIYCQISVSSEEKPAKLLYEYRDVHELHVFTRESVYSLEINVYQTADKAILGENPFTLSCSYRINSLERLIDISLMRKRESDFDFTTIVTFRNPFSPMNVTYYDSSLESRTVATKPTTASKTAKLVFNTIECNDKATYKWQVYYYDGTHKAVEDTSNVTVKAKTLFGKQDHRSLSYAPSTDLEEGDNVVFTCSGDVGNEPVGHLGWFYYLNSDTSIAINASSRATSTAPVYQSSTCSYTRTSTLQLTMLREFSNIMVRCTVQQDKYNQFGDVFVQTENIPVFYAPNIYTMPHTKVNEGRDIHTLCKAESNPAPVYSWLLPNGSLIHGQTLLLWRSTVEDTGWYTCIVYNTFKSKNHTVGKMTFIQILKSTAMASTLTPILESANISTHVQKSCVGDVKTSSEAAVFIGVGVGTCVFTLIIVGCVYLLTRHIRRRRKHTNTGWDEYMTNIRRERSYTSFEEVRRQDGQINPTSYYNHRLPGSGNVLLETEAVRDFENPTQYDQLDDSKREEYQYTGLQTNNYEELEDAKREEHAYFVNMESTNRN